METNISQTSKNVFAKIWTKFSAKEYGWFIQDQWYRYITYLLNDIDENFLRHQYCCAFITVAHELFENYLGTIDSPGACAGKCIMCMELGLDRLVEIAQIQEKVTNTDFRIIEIGTKKRKNVIELIGNKLTPQTAVICDAVGADVSKEELPEFLIGLTYMAIIALYLTTNDEFRDELEKLLRNKNKGLEELFNILSMESKNHDTDGRIQKAN